MHESQRHQTYITISRDHPRILHNQADISALDTFLLKGNLPRMIDCWKVGWGIPVCCSGDSPTINFIRTLSQKLITILRVKWPFYPWSKSTSWSKSTLQVDQTRRVSFVTRRVLELRTLKSLLDSPIHPMTRRVPKLFVIAICRTDSSSRPQTHRVLA